MNDLWQLNLAFKLQELKLF